ncbi:MAG: GntR family transcriptional regulator [Acetobacteraceae bacterium]
MRPRAPKTTRAGLLRAQIADDILGGQLQPGTPLDEVSLAQRFGVSRTPVREALRALAASGLVEVQPHRGAIVTRPSAQEVEDMFAVMAELEALCAGRAAVAMTPPERRALGAIHATLRDLIRTGDPQRYHEVNERFHHAIYLGSHNAYLAEVTLATRRRLQPFRRAQFRTAGRLALSYQEHDRVVRAIERGDRAEAAQAMRDHIGIVHFAYEHYAQDLDQPLRQRLLPAGEEHA